MIKKKNMLGVNTIHLLLDMSTFALLMKICLQFCVSCNILSVANTDHRAIVLEMNKSDFVRGPGYWRFNNSYLQDATFINKMNELLDNLLIEKEEIQGNALSYWGLCQIKTTD